MPTSGGNAKHDDAERFAPDPFWDRPNADILADFIALTAHDTGNTAAPWWPKVRQGIDGSSKAALIEIMKGGSTRGLNSWIDGLFF